MESPLPISQADVVVVGAGAFGLSVAYQLSRLHRGTIAVLDRFEPGSQTSPRAAGLYKQVQATESASHLANLSIEIIRGFAAESGVPLSYVNSGSILAARTAAHADLIAAEANAARAWGVELEPLDGPGVARVAPYLTGKGIRAAFHIPGDIYIEEPAWLLQAYLTALQASGALVVGHAPVNAITVTAGEVSGVETPRGKIATPLVIDAAGIWARGIAGMAGAELAIAPVRHQLLITRPIAGMVATEPIARIVDASAYLRPARGGLMLGGMEQDPLMFDPRQETEFQISDTPLDFNVLDGFIDAIGPLVPALGDTPVAEHRGGLFTMTPDGRFLAGPVPGVRGLWAATGCNGSGFSISAGIGRTLAEWIVAGEPSIDLSLFDPGRFGPGPFNDAELATAGAWQYANYYTPEAV